VPLGTLPARARQPPLSANDSASLPSIFIVIFYSSSLLTAPTLCSPHVASTILAGIRAFLCGAIFDWPACHHANLHAPEFFVYDQILDRRLKPPQLRTLSALCAPSLRAPHTEKNRMPTVIAIWGVVAIASAIIGGIVAGTKRRNHSFWAAWSFLFPPILLVLLLMPTNKGPRPRQPGLDELEQREV
jgi:hypothetical protein